MSRISALASNALLTKSRAMNSKMLTYNDYQALASCKSLNDVVSYLKSNTDYVSALSTLSGADVYRARLEADIRKANAKKISSLVGFEKAIGQRLNKIIYLRRDISILLDCVDKLKNDDSIENTWLLSVDYEKHSEMELKKVLTAKNFDELYQALDGSILQRPFDVVRNQPKDFNVIDIENAMYKLLAKEVNTLVKKNFSKKDSGALLELFKMQADLKMLESIVRMKKYFPQQSLNINNIFYSALSSFSVKEIESMLEMKSTDEVFSMFLKGEYRKYLDPDLKDEIELCTRNAKYRYNKKNLVYSTLPELTMFCYIGIIENETKNLINIIEGVRYSLSSEDILKFVVADKDNGGKE